MSLLVGAGVVLVITALTGYFVAQEFAYMAVDRARLQARADAGDDVARRTLDITRRTSFMLSGAQLGITVTGLLVGYVAEPLIGKSLADVMDGGLSRGLALVLGTLVALAFSTIVQMLFGELIPKNYAIARAEAVSGALAPSTRAFLTVFGPLIWVFDKAAELVLRVLGIAQVHDVEHSATAVDLEHVVEESRDRGELSPELSRMIDRIIDFPRQDVEHAMVPRSRVDVVRDTATVGEVRELMATGHTRYPVLDDQEHILGIVRLVDILNLQAEGRGDDTPVTETLRRALVVPALMDLPDALRAMDEADSQLACVVDEYGGFTGIVTFEDLAEEIVGEITDEHDLDDPIDEHMLDDGGWTMPGDVHIDEVERALLVDLPRGDYETIAGLVIDEYGDLPAVGAVVNIELPIDAADLMDDDDPVVRTLRAEVLEVDHYVPSRLRLTLPDPQPGDRDRDGDRG